jgi:hypothetical protein
LAFEYNQKVAFETLEVMKGWKNWGLENLVKPRGGDILVGK